MQGSAPSETPQDQPPGGFDPGCDIRLGAQVITGYDGAWHLGLDFDP